jgi:hypothetical protein
MGAVAQSPTALPRLLSIAAVPTAAFLVFAVWLLAGWGGPSTSGMVHFAGALGFPSFAAASAAVAARRGRGRQRPGVDGDDRRPGRPGARLDGLDLSPILARQRPTHVSAGGDDRVLGLSVGRLRRVACLPGRLFGCRPLSDAAGRHDRRRVAVRRGLGCATPQCVRPDRCCRWPVRCRGS